MNRGIVKIAVTQTKVGDQPAWEILVQTKGIAINDADGVMCKLLDNLEARGVSYRLQDPAKALGARNLAHLPRDVMLDCPVPIQFLAKEKEKISDHELAISIEGSLAIFFSVIVPLIEQSEEMFLRAEFTQR